MESIQLEFDFGEIYEVICKSEYCTFVVTSGTEQYCNEYIKNNSSENIYPLSLRVKENK